MMLDDKRLDLAVATVKCLSMDGVEKAKSGHPGTPMGLSELTLNVWLRHLRYDPKDPAWEGRDRFVLSAGHASMLLYSMLHLAGYDLSLDELMRFRQWGSKTPGHPEHGLTPGVETTTGPLGQGVGNAVGLALGLKMKAARFGAAYEGARVFVIASDGDLMEGISGEASSIAGHLGLSNLIVLYDDNHITIEGDTALAFSEETEKRYEGYGFHVAHVDGHDRKAIADVLAKATAPSDRPWFIRARTHIAHGAPNAVDTSEAHGAPLGDKEIGLTKTAMGWDPQKTFVVPEEVRALFRERAEELRGVRKAWDERVRAHAASHAESASQRTKFEAKAIPSDLFDTLLAAVPNKDDATRNLSNVIQQVVAKHVPSLIGGSADLAPSTKTLVKDGGSVARGAFGGRNLHFGIREHAMGSVCNGLALAGGFIPYGATFLVFSDYMRPAVRLSALMDLSCIWIFTHDSIFLGEDGPTHQPIEHLWALRMIPNLAVVRPADGLETAAAWAMALSRTHGPTAFALTRQKTAATKRPEGFDPKVMLRGGYVLAEANGGVPDVVLIGTGSEVELCIGAKAALEAEGKKVRVVSMPCVEVFQVQDAAYQASVLPPGVRRVSVEAGRTDPWHKVLGQGGLAIGIDRYGASAPDKVLGAEFGFTVESVTKRVRGLL